MQWLHEETPETVADIWADTVKTHGAALAEAHQSNPAVCQLPTPDSAGTLGGYCTSDERAGPGPVRRRCAELPDDNGLNCAAF